MKVIKKKSVLKKLAVTTAVTCAVAREFDSYKINNMLQSLIN